MKKTSEISGTHRQGTLLTTLRELTEVFGEPEILGFDKVFYQWAFIHRGTVFTIYDYKRDLHPIDEDEQFEWSVGGHSRMAFELAMSKFNSVR
jgi:hypothetical protein